MTNIKLFDPMTMDSNTLPNVAGNYVFLLRKGSQLPKVDIEPQIPEVTLDGNTYQAIYTGIASNSLRKRGLFLYKPDIPHDLSELPGQRRALHRK